MNRMNRNIYQSIVDHRKAGNKLLSILIDPDKFDVETTAEFLRKLPANTTHIFVGGSTVEDGETDRLVRNIKMYTSKPVILFPGDVNQISDSADALLFLSLLSGDNSEYLIGQHIKAIPLLKNTGLEVIPTAYLLIDGGQVSSVSRVTKTKPISQDDSELIVNTAMAGELMGKKMIYLEAGSGAINPVKPDIISTVSKLTGIPLIVGGGIRTDAQRQAAYDAGADMVVMGTIYEKQQL